MTKTFLGERHDDAGCRDSLESASRNSTLEFGEVEMAKTFTANGRAVTLAAEQGVFTELSSLERYGWLDCDFFCEEKGPSVCGHGVFFPDHRLFPLCIST